MRIDDRAGLPPADLAALDAEVSRLHSLEQLIHWGFAARPPFELAEVVVQDEFTHDVVIAWRSGRYLAFDST